MIDDNDSIIVLFKQENKRFLMVYLTFFIIESRSILSIVGLKLVFFKAYSLFVSQITSSFDIRYK